MEAVKNVFGRLVEALCKYDAPLTKIMADSVPDFNHVHSFLSFL